MAKTNPAFMSGVPELLILQLLARKEMYGYQLVKEINLVSKETFNLAEGVVYPILHALEQKGALKSKEKAINGRMRVYYNVTAAGRRRLQQLQHEWQRVTDGVRTVLGESYV